MTSRACCRRRSPGSRPLRPRASRARGRASESAATRYGTEASNGVIQIFTKRGSNSAPRWHFNASQEAIQFPDRVAPNAGYAKTQAQADSLSTYWQMPGLKPFQVFEVPIWNDYLTETGMASALSGQVNGGSPTFTYFAS